MRSSKPRTAKRISKRRSSQSKKSTQLEKTNLKEVRRQIRSFRTEIEKIFQLA